MSTSMYHQKRWLHLSFIIIGVLLSMMVFFSVRVAFPEARALVAWFAAAQFAIIVLLVVFNVFRILTQYVQSFYDLTPSEAWQLVKRSLINLRRYPPAGPTLRVADGQVDPEGSVVIHEIGGPGYLSVDHNNVAVTQRLGKLNRIWAPGFGPLEPYERVWDVVDIRPQHRTLRVSFMTRDGIPATCDAEMTFRVAETFNPGPEERWVGADLRQHRSDPRFYRSRLDARHDSDYAGRSGDARWTSIELKPRRSSEESASPPEEKTQDAGTDDEARDTSYAYSEDAVLNLVTSKYVTSSTDPQAISDWTIGISRGALDGAIRDELEKYRMDQFLDPIATLEEDPVSDTELRHLEQLEAPDRDTKARDRSPDERKPLHEIEATVAKEVRETGKKRGILVESVELTELKPEDRAVSQQWLDYWRARVQARLDEYHARSRLDRVMKVQLIRADIKVELIREMLKNVRKSANAEGRAEFSSDLIITEFLGVLESMCGQGPEMQRFAFQQAESLIRVINAIQQRDSPFGPTTGGLISPRGSEGEEER